MQSGKQQAQPARRGISAAWRLLIAAALTLLSAAPVFSAPATQSDLPCRDVSWNAVTDTPAALRDCTAPDAASDDPVETARAFLRENAAPLGLQAALGDLEFVSLRHGLAGSHVFFQQQRSARPVLGTYVSVHMRGRRQRRSAAQRLPAAAGGPDFRSQDHRRASCAGSPPCYRVRCTAAAAARRRS